MNLARLPRKFCQAIGMDRAIGASTATQLIRFVTGPITMLLMIRYLSPEEQGFSYSFAGVVGIQVFLEAGFAQSIIQFSSREFARLRFNSEGFLVGERAALSRLRSIFHKANRYYTAMAAVLTLSLAIGGYCFFASKPDYGVPWKLPWLVVSICAGLSFLLTPFWAVLEGCNRVAEIATYRFWATLVGFATSAICLPLGLGIHVAIWASLTSLLFPVAYLALRKRRFMAQIFRPAGSQQVSWGNEIWGFQWRIAGTWMSRYFLESGIAPLALHLNGPIVAGQVGMTFQMVRMIGGIANNWTVVRIPAWGAMAARGMWVELNSAWALAARRNVTFCVSGLALFLCSLFYLPLVSPDFSARFLPFGASGGLVVGWMLYSLWLVSAHYTRALRMEPYVFMHVLVGLVFLALCFLLNPHLGSFAIPWAFAAVHLPASLAALVILRGVRSKLAAQR